MWIRSQNKEVLKDCDLFSISDKTLIIGTKDGIANTLGVYESKERCIEVLDEIQLFIQSRFTQREEKDDTMKYTTMNVYQMPEK